jgi:hypothetical protein
VGLVFGGAKMWGALGLLVALALNGVITPLTKIYVPSRSRFARTHFTSTRAQGESVSTAQGLNISALWADVDGVNTRFNFKKVRGPEYPLYQVACAAGMYTQLPIGPCQITQTFWDAYVDTYGRIPMSAHLSTPTPM